MSKLAFDTFVKGFPSLCLQGIANGVCFDTLAKSVLQPSSSNPPKMSTSVVFDDSDKGLLTQCL